MRKIVIDLLVAAGFIGAFFAGRLSTGHPGDTLLAPSPLDLLLVAEAPSAAPDADNDGRITVLVGVDGTISGGPYREAAGVLTLELVDRYAGAARLVVERAVTDGAPLTVATIDLPRPLAGSSEITLPTAGDYRLLVLRSDDTLLGEAALGIAGAGTP